MATAKLRLKFTMSGAFLMFCLDYSNISDSDNTLAAYPNFLAAGVSLSMSLFLVL